jgi:anthranilate phosphoribosyltransferase
MGYSELLNLNTMKAILNYLYSQKTLTRKESEEVLSNIAAGKYNNSQIASFISVYIMRNITVDELAGFRDALLKHCVPIDLSAYNTIDMCGTGGDGKDTFNISTLASFVVAGAGEKVAKHGNVGVSSGCGSSNVLESLGYKFSNDPAKLKKEIEETNICYLHAPLFNSAMKNVAPVRKELGVKTFFNMLGPMVNPSSPKNQLVGVYNLDLARLYTYIYQQTDKNFCIIHSLDGYDEISLTSDFKMIMRNEEKIIKPEELGFATIKPEQLSAGASVEDSKQIFMNILEGKGTIAQNNVVVSNAALGLKCMHPEKSLDDSIAQSAEVIKSGKALNVLRKLISLQ